MKKRIICLCFTLLFISAILTGCNSNAVLNKVGKNLSTYDIEVVYNDDYTANLNQTINYKNNTDTMLTSICFHVYVKSFCANVENSPVGALNTTKAYPNGKSYATFEMENVFVKNKPADFNFLGIDEDILEVDVGKLAPNDKIEISFEYNFSLPNCLHRFGYGPNTINFGNFYLIACVYENGDFVKDSYHSNGDPFYSDMANYIVKITYPEKFILASSGNVERESLQDNLKTTKITATAIRDFAFVLSRDFLIISDTINGINVNYYYFNDNNHINSLKTAVDSIATFNDMFGKYPYRVLNVVQTNFVHGGMEYPNLIYISDSVEGKDYINVIIHETAHQWWYGVVGNNEYKHPWLDEGLTEYSTLLFYEKNTEYGIDTVELIKTLMSSYTTFIDLYSSVLGSVDTTMDRALNEYNTEPEYVYIAYVKGQLFFDSIRRLIGDINFFNSLKAYYASYQFTNVTPDHLLYAFEKTTKMSLEGIFDSWVKGKVLLGIV